MIKATEFSKELNIYFKGEKVNLSEEYRSKVENNWNIVKKDKPNFFNGEIFGIADIKEDEKSLNFYVKKSEYAHYLYSYIEKEDIKSNIQIAYTLSVVESSDGYFMIGVMGEETASAGELHFVGGQLNVDGVPENGKLDEEENMKRELFEELGIDCEDSDRVQLIEPYLFVGDKSTMRIAIAHRILMKDTKKQLEEKFNKYKESLISKGEIPEICDLEFVKKDKEEVREFLKTDKRVKNDATERILEIFAYDEELNKNFL